MATYGRVASTGDGGIVIEVDGVRITIGDLSSYDTAAALKAEAERQAGGSLDDLYFHVNRDGSVVIATGSAPAVWPEDEGE